MESRQGRYRACVATCLATDYGSPASVLRHNRAADEMRLLAGEPGAAAELLPLLDEPASARWLVFQLIEAGGLPDHVAERCLAVVRAMAAGDSAEAMAARIWLRKHR